MVILYDLHTHSHCSDGQLSPTDLVKLAKSRGVKVLALTDHDTVAGIAEARAAADQDIQIIAGVEFSALWNGRGIHIVGLQVDTESPILRAAIEEQEAARQNRAVTIAQKLEKAGVKGALDGALHYAGEGVVGRPHFAQYLVDAGYVATFAQAFKRYLGAGKPGDVKQCWPEISTVIHWINQSGGIAVLAHPDKYDMTRTKLYSLLEDFAAAGGRGLEVVSGQQANSVTANMARAADDFSLLASCGSDFHATGQSWQALGHFPELPANCQPVWQYFNK